MPAAQTDLPSLTNIVNPSVPSHQAPTVNPRTGNVEPSPTLPPCNPNLDPRTGNMLRAERTQDQPPDTPQPQPVFPNPPATITDAGSPYQIPPSNA